MLTEEDPINSYEGPSAAHRLSFSSKKRKKHESIHDRLQRSITGTYEIYEK